MSDDDRQRPPNFQNLQSLVLPPVPRASNHNGSATSNITHADLSRRQLSTTTRGQHSSEPYPKSSNKGGVRGRVTVVCAECKRLKLRCSRERPCTSCIKRACTDRCRYRNDEQPLTSTPSGEQRSIIPTTASGDLVYRQVSTNCVQCSSSNVKCDRREPCSHCMKQGIDCVYQGLAPLAIPSESTLAHALVRLSRLESRLGEIVGPECDQCAELQLKCDGSSPCSWCRKRHSGSSRIGGELEAIGLNLPNHTAGGGPTCSYVGYSEQSQRQGTRSPQSALHANTGNGSRDLSPYALRVSSPPPPGSSHSSASTATEILSRIASAENQLSNYMRSQNHSFSHGHSLSHGSATSMTSGGGVREGGGAGAPGGPLQSFGSSSTLTPITPSHPSSLHHYVVSGSGSGHTHSHSGHHHSYSQTDLHHHSHHHQQQQQQPPPSQHHHHQRSSSRHSPPQHPNSAHLQPLDSSSYSPDGRQETHRPRQLSMSSSSHLPRHQGSNMTPTTTSPGSYGFSSREAMTKPLKIPTPPGSGSSPAVGLPSQQSAGASSQGTKLPEISNILTLLSPAPISSSTAESKSPHAFPTPVSGVVSSSHSILNIGVGPNIQHTQSDVRGSANTSTTSSVRHGHQGSDSSRRGSADYARPASREDVPSTSTSPPLHRSASASRPNSSDAPQQQQQYLRHRRSNSPPPPQQQQQQSSSLPSLYQTNRKHKRENSGPMDAEYEKDRGVYLQQQQLQASDKVNHRLARPHSSRRNGEEDEDDEMEVEVDEIDD